MIVIEKPLGNIEITQNYFQTLIGDAVTSCFGVSGMANTNMMQSLRSMIKRRDKQYIDQGVSVKNEDGGLVVDLHILVTYGLNISATVKSIVNKVRYVVEEATSLDVKKVNVFVDGLTSE